MKKFGLEAKVVISVMLVALFISIVERYEMSANIIKQFRASEKSRTTLLVNTISPIISLNISLGLIEANQEYLDEIIKQNSDILMLKILDKDNAILYNYETQKDKIKKDNGNYFSQDVIDTVMNEHVAKVQLYTSDERYHQVLKNNTQITIEIFSILLIVLIFSTFLLKREFSSLKKLTNNILKYDPVQNNFPLTPSQREDEVGIIHNAIINMVKKINRYTHLLENANQEKEKTNLILSQQAKMASLGEMLASVSHQWKQPLSVISSVNIKIKMLSDIRGITQAEVDESTNAIEKQLEFMTQTLKDFSEFFHPDKEMTKFSILNSIQSIITLFGSEYKKNNITINIHHNLLDENFNIISYNNEFRQVILNIFSNAKDAILESGTLHKDIDVSLSSTQNRVIISIQDYAGGIDPSVQNKLFDPYITTKSAEKGSGIGLYMSKRIIETSMQGTIEVINQNGGAFFTIILPFITEKKHES